MYTLFMCLGMFLGICGNVRQFDFNTIEQCEEQRKQVPKESIGKGYVICIPKQKEKNVQIQN